MMVMFCPTMVICYAMRPLTPVAERTGPPPAPQTTRWLNVANGRHRVARPKSNCQRLRRRISTANH